MVFSLHKEDLLKLEVNGIIHLQNVEEDKTLNLEELYQKLIKDLKCLNLPVEEVTIKLRPYSETYYGRYFPDKQRLFIYPFKNREGTIMSYTMILCTTIHEMVHHIQHQDPTFKRKKGVMHDPQFWKLYNHFIDRAVKLNIVTSEEVERFGS